jgi:GNAT superfamily N-acetyltransferase
MRSDVQIVAADHPSLDGDVERFLGGLRSERRYFGPTGRANPKPFPSLISTLSGRGGFRLAAVECGRIVGLVRVDGAGELSIAVGAEHRRAGIGSALCRAASERAAALGHGRLLVRSTRRSRAVRELATGLGAVVVERDRGRTELLLDVSVGERSA